MQSCPLANVVIRCDIFLSLVFAFILTQSQLKRSILSTYSFSKYCLHDCSCIVWSFVFNPQEEF